MFDDQINLLTDKISEWLKCIIAIYLSGMCLPYSLVHNYIDSCQRDLHTWLHSGRDSVLVRVIVNLYVFFSFNVQIYLLTDKIFEWLKCIIAIYLSGMCFPYNLVHNYIDSYQQDLHKWLHSGRHSMNTRQYLRIRC